MSRMAPGAEEIVAGVQSAWRPLRDAAGRLEPAELELATSAGWTAKEMLAHVAFWDEAVLGVVLGMFRQEALPDGWTFGSGYLPEEGEGWPAADVHNAREAAWALGHTGAEVLDRLDRAHDQLLAILSTVTEQEAGAHRDYFASLALHYLEHQPEVEGVAR